MNVNYIIEKIKRHGLYDYHMLFITEDSGIVFNAIMIEENIITLVNNQSKSTYHSLKGKDIIEHIEENELTTNLYIESNYADYQVGSIEYIEEEDIYYFNIVKS